MPHFTAHIEKKYGIKSIPLNEHFPAFMDDCQNHRIMWAKADDDICGRIQTFLLLIAKIKYKSADCYYCIYPHESTAEYTVFICINPGQLCLILTTIRDKGFYPNDGRRIQMLKDGLLFLDTPQDILFNIHQGILDQQHPNEQSHH